MKLIITGKIQYFTVKQVIFVKVPNLPEFKVDEYAKKFLNDSKIYNLVPEMLEYNERLNEIN